MQRFRTLPGLILASAVLWLAGCVAPLRLPLVVPVTADATPTAYPLPTQVIEPGLVRQVEASAAARRQHWRQLAPIQGDLAAETEHLRIFVEDGHLPVDLQTFQVEAEAVYDYVRARLETSSDKKFAVAFRPPDTSDCPVRGLAMASPEPQTILFVDEKASHAYILGVLAHELGHLLHAHGLQAGGDTYLSEGLATWAAGEYWRAWRGETPAESVQTYLREGRYVPLHEYYRQDAGYQRFEGEDCLAERDRRYLSWAAFVGFLIDRYGLEKMVELLNSTQPLEGATMTQPPPTASPPPGNPPMLEERIIAQRTIRPPDYLGVYGLELNQLEAAWLRGMGGGD